MIQAGSPEHLGAHWDGQGVNFALYSSSADAVELVPVRCVRAAGTVLLLTWSSGRCLVRLFAGL